MIGCNWLLLIWKKSNFNDGFKLELVTTYHLEFVMKFVSDVKMIKLSIYHIYIYIYIYNFFL